MRRTGRPHTLKLALLDGDGRPVIVPTPIGDRPLELDGQFEVGRPPGIKPGTPLNLPLAMNIGPLPLRPDQLYVWKLMIDGRLDEDWQVSFSTRPAQGADPALGSSPPRA